MSNVEAIDIAEGYRDAKDEAEYIAAWQQLIDTGLAWNLQGWVGRTAKYMIEQGYCRESR